MRWKLSKFRILIRVQAPWKNEYRTRPLPKVNYERVKELVNRKDMYGQKCRWDKEAAELCEPDWEAPLHRTD